MNKINFQDGTRVSRAKVTIDDVDYIVTPATFSGATPLSAYVMNTLQTNVETAINQNVDNIGGEEYDDTETYEVGDIVKYGGRLYICQTTISMPEEFNPINWQETDVLSSAGGNEIAIGSSSDITGKTKIYVEEATQRLKYKDSTSGQFTDIAGDEVFIGEEQDIPDSTKLWIDTDELLPEASEVVNSLEGNETTKAPSVRAVKDELATINNKFVYSTEEQRIGTYLGKPLYRKVIEYTTQPSAENNTFQHGIANIDRYKSVDIIVERKDGVTNLVPRYTPGETAWNFYINDVTKTEIGFSIGSSLRNNTYWKKAVFTFEYTKTTD